MSKRYVVTGEYITVTTTDMVGQRVLLGYYRGALLPEDLTDEAIEHHLSTGQIMEVQLDADGTLQGTDFIPEGTPEAAPEKDADGKEVTQPDGLGEPNKMPEAQTSGQRPGYKPGEVKAGDSVPEPNRRNGTRDEWVDYAVSKGADREEIESKQVSKQDLIAVHGTPK